MSDEPVPDPLAQLDQAMAEMATLAKIIHAHYAAMLAAGFTCDQALALTLSYQATVVAHQFARSSES